MRDNKENATKNPTAVVRRDVELISTSSQLMLVIGALRREYDCKVPPFAVVNTYYI